MLKPRQRFKKSKKHNLITEEVNRIALTANDAKKIINLFNKNVAIRNEQRPSMQKMKLKVTI